MKKLLFIVNEDYYFLSHRTHLALSAISEGFEVAVLCHVNSSREKITNLGLQLFAWNIKRGSLNPISEIRSFIELASVIHRFKPDLIHAVSLKAVLYTALATIKNHNCSLVYALGGLGYVFHSNKLSASVIRFFIAKVFGYFFSRPNVRIILQNDDDLSLLLRYKAIKKENVKFIYGVGVDTNYFNITPIPSGKPLIVLPARLLWSKGVREFVSVAKILRQRGLDVRFALVGEIDIHNPETVPSSQIDTWVSEGVVEAWGHRNDMYEVYKQSTIVCQPAHHEGLPKSLLEAASCGRPIVCFDVPGCREIVINGVNGFLAPFMDIQKLAQSIEELINNYDLCVKMGKAGRELILKEFTQEIKTKETIDVWHELLGDIQ